MSLSKMFWRYIARRVVREMREQALLGELERHERAERREVATDCKIADWPASVGKKLLASGYTARGVREALRETIRSPPS